jgi:hypothetical protein
MSRSPNGVGFTNHPTLTEYTSGFLVRPLKIPRTLRYYNRRPVKILTHYDDDDDDDDASRGGKSRRRRRNKRKTVKRKRQTRRRGWFW